jgi:myo-inositol-1(or 4)-monophosphatase
MDISYLLEAVIEAGEFARKSFKDGIYKNSESAFQDVREKSLNELVLKEDLICEKIIISKIKQHNPNAIIYSEESSDISKLKNDKSPIKYLIDPLDGTHNYFFGIPLWGICVAVLNSDNISIGSVIYVPMLDLLLKCEGANDPSYILDNGSWNKVYTKKRAINKSLVCYDNQFYKLGDQAIKMYDLISKQCFTTRITGSAVCDAALIATGKINARIWNKTNPYDVGAGMLIVKGAGGSICDLAGNEINTLSEKVIMCSDIELKEELLKLI